MAPRPRRSRSAAHRGGPATVAIARPAADRYAVPARTSVRCPARSQGPAGHRLEDQRPIRRSSIPQAGNIWRILSSLSGERDLIGSHRWPQVWQSAIVKRTKGPDRRHLRAAARHPTRRDGARALAALLLPWVADLVAARGHHHLDAGTVAGVSISLAALWIAWATFRGPKRPTDPVSGLTLGQVADRLAVAVGDQWETEADRQRLNDPSLPVSWTAADVDVADDWDSLVRLASSGGRWPAPPSPGAWAAGPADLAGKAGELAEVLARVPTGRLVVLGEPGDVGMQARVTGPLPPAIAAGATARITGCGELAPMPRQSQLTTRANCRTGPPARG